MNHYNDMILSLVYKQMLVEDVRLEVANVQKKAWDGLLSIINIELEEKKRKNGKN